MKSISKILNGVAAAIQNLAAIITPSNPKKIDYKTKTITSNPSYSNVKITSDVKVKQPKAYEISNPQFVNKLSHIPKAEKDALDAIYKAIVDKGSHPDHHDHLVRELSTKWPVLHKALAQLVRARKENYNPYSSYSSKAKQKW